jgi:hypothetical protein
VADPSPAELDALDILRAEGLTPGLLAVAALLRSQAPNGLRRWQALSEHEILEHLRSHSRLTDEDPRAVDDDSGHPNTAHTAARALMALVRVVE